MTYHIKSTPRLSGSILYTLISVFSLTLITACGGGGLKLDANLNITDGRLATLCAANPFVTACADFADERKSFIDRCVADDETVADGLCATATTFVCTDNPFPEICDDDQEYLIKRDDIVTACAAEQEENCNDTQLIHFCEDNPYHARCIDDTSYDTNRADILATCGTATKHKRCAVAIVPVCTDNPFNIVCQGDAIYEDARESNIATCDNGFRSLDSQLCMNVIEATCVGAGITNYPVLCNGVEADVTITGTCDADRFATACDDSEIYIEARREFCVDPATASDTRCAAVVTSTCMDNPFHGLCLAGTTYDAPRNVAITDCIAVPIGVLCRDAIVHACTDNPFHAICFGASAMTYAPARTSAVTNCGDGTTTITEQICTDAVLHTCEGDGADVFNAVCIMYGGQAAQTTACSDSDDATRCYLTEQINACAEGIETARCAGVGTGAISTCTADPFATACVAGSTFAPYLSGAQGTRFTYCSAEGVSATDELCASYRACKTAFDDGTTLPAGCGGSTGNFSTTLRDGCVVTAPDFLFSTECDGGRFDTERSEFCSMNEGGVNNLFHANCTAAYQDTTARNTFCESNPFHTNCTNTDYADEREDNCAGDTPHAKCVTPALLATAHPADIPTTTTQTKFTDSFLHVVTLRDDGTLAPIQGVVTATQETRTATVTGDITIGRRGGAIGPDGEPNTNPDGYAFFKLVRQGAPGDTNTAPRTSQHSAILSTTNLGAPLTSAPTIAIWPGHFTTNTETTPTAVDFYINFTTDGGTLGFINTARDGIGRDGGAGNVDDRPAATIVAGIHLSASFNAAGIVGGFVSLDDLRGNNALNVFGLIGQEGLVATFTDVNNQTGKFGAITASNPAHDGYEPPAAVLDVAVEDRDADSDAGKVNYSDWVGSFDPQTTLSEPKKSEILQTTTFTDGIRGFASLAAGANTKAFDFSNHNYFRSRLLRGDAKNGLAVRAQGGNYYTGVLHTADLGAPIRTASGRAEWRAFLFVQDTPTGGELRKAFDLDVIFGGGGNGDIAGGVRDDIKNVASVRIFGITGKFDPRGVITGTLTRTAGQISAPISGIIGQDGAIGVFASNEAGNKFAGGFIALPHQVQNVTYGGVWTATHAAGRDGLFVTPQTYNHWLHGDARSASGNVVNGQSTLGITAGTHNGGLLTFANGSWKAASLGGQAADGVAFYTGVRTDIGRRFYSGVTSGTDLGKPVTTKSGSATWYGQMSTRQNNGRAIVTNYGDIALTINFSGTGGTITGALLANAVKSPGYRYEVAGWFNEDGLVEGNVNTRTTSGGFETGFLSGLIGEQGVVGAFIAPNVAGGFVATPRKPRNVDVTYADFLHYAQSQGEAITNVPHNVTGRLNEILVTSPTAPYNVSYGHIRTDDGAYTGSVTVDAVFGADTKPAGLTGGYSHLYGVWNASNGLGQNESTLQRAYHAGIHPNTNVGPHLVTRTSNVTLNFKARISIRGSRTFKYANLSPVYTDNQQFRMSINLRPDQRAINSRDNASSARPIGGGNFHSLEATWDDRGVMTGTIQNSHADYPNGRVTGLIGQYGAVAVIISDYNRHYGYSGGLVACATAENDGRGACER